MEKISLAQFNEIQKYFTEAQTEYNEARKKQIVDNCQKCKGTGITEQLDNGDPAYNPYGSILHCNCVDCDGKGYVE